MSEIGINQVLAQIRAMSAASAAKPAAAPMAQAPGFESLLKNSIDKVASAQNDSAAQQRAFELGDSNADLASVMLASAKAQVSFKAMVETRNRLVSAYQEIMNMPI